MPQAATSPLYYLYVGNAWTGPFEVAQIRFFLRQHQVAADTYAFDHERQQHHTVGELLARAAEPVAEVETRSQSRPATHTLSADPKATIGVATAVFDRLGPDLDKLYQAYLDLTEDRSLDRAGSLRALKDHGAAFRILVTAAASDVATLSDLCAQVMRVGDYLANRHQDHALWDRLEILRGLRPQDDPEEAAAAAVAVIEVIQERAERTKPGVKAEIVDEDSDRWEQPGLRTAKGMIADARAELLGTVEELATVQKAYADLQERHATDVETARETLAAVESRLADEEAARRQALAEIRSLAAEVHRLGSEHLAHDAELRDELSRLAEELGGDNATAIAPLAESLLIRLVTRLRSAAGGESGDLARLREELASVRTELVQARAQALVLSEERDRLRRQLEEQRQAAERAMGSAREREQRLRSTVAAMEVTRDLHQDVMRELEVQLTGAQHRVSEMESELSTVRTELKSTRTSLDEKSNALQDEMRRAVELKAMLEARREELSANLRSAEAELKQAQGADEEADPALVEALMARVQQLRTTFEATKRKLDEQQALASRLEDDLAASRREAQELRGRSDNLTGELNDARSNLAQAKRRFEELQRAYQRLEQERESLQQEVGRKGTDAIAKDPATATATSSRLGAQPSGTQRLAKVVADLEARLAETQRRLDQTALHLDQERDRARQAHERLESLTGAIDDLTAERDHLRGELDQLHAQQVAEHGRHAAALATATQATIEAERRARTALARVEELEQDLAEATAHPALEPRSMPDPALAEARAAAEAATAEVARLQADLEAARRATPEPLARLAELEERLARTIAERDDQAAVVQAGVADRERLQRELARLQNEHDSAAVEHRAALKSARDRLGEAQTRVQGLQQELEQARTLLTAQADGAGRDKALADLAEAARQLATERERATALDAAVAEARRATDEAQRRTQGLEERLAGAAADRDRLTLDIERLKGELAMAQAAGNAARSADAHRAGDAERRLAEVAADREHLLAQLSQVTGDLTVARQRLTKLEAEAIGAERLALEQTRVRELEARLAEARQDHQSALGMAAEARTRLAALHAERDRLQVEVERLRAGASTGTPEAAELAELRLRVKKLVRSRRKLRAERDALREQLERALAAVQQMPITGVTERAPSSERTDSLDPLPMLASDATGLTARVPRPLPGAASATFVAAGTYAPTGAEGRVAHLGFTSAIARPGVTVRVATEGIEPLTQRTVARRRDEHRRRTLRQVAVVGSVVLLVGGLGTLAVRSVPVAERAVVNATLTTLRSPIAGRVQSTGGAPGVLVKAGDTVAAIVNPTPDASRVREAERRLANLTIEQQAFADAKATRAKRRADLNDQVKQQKARLLAEAEAAVAQARRELAEAQAAYRGRTDGDALIAGRTESLVRIEARLGLLRAGTYPTEALDGIKEIASLDALDTAADAAQADLEKRRIAAEADVLAAQADLESRRQATLSTSEPLLVWRRDVAPGDWVAAQAPVMQMAVPATRVIEAVFPERHAAALAEGGGVRVQVGDQWVDATIRQVSSVPPTRTEARAVDLTPGPGRLAVAIELPAGVEPTIGQTVRVIGGGADAGVIQQTLHHLARWFR